MNWVPDAVIFLIPVVGSVAFFSFLAVIGWAAERRKEREAYYRYEFRKKLVDAGEMTARHVHELMVYEVQSAAAARREGLIIGGLITVGTGVGLLLGLRFIDDESLWMVGYIPLSIGLAMLGYGAFVAPKMVPTPPLGALAESDRPRDA